MNFDELQKNWQEQKIPDLIQIDSAILLRELQRNKQSFDVTIFWRDFREVAVALILIVCVVYDTIKTGDYKLLYIAGACVFIILFLLIDRLRQSQLNPDPGPNAPLRQTAEYSLARVRHQIRLLKNVFWWYLLPIAAAIAIIYLDGIHWNPAELIAGLPHSAIIPVGGAILFTGIYFLNQLAVRYDLQPRRQELEILLTRLTASVPEETK